MIYVFVFLLGGAGLLGYGIWEQKTRYNTRNYAEAEVVGHQTARSGGLMFQAVNTAAGIVNPLVSIMLPNGVTKVVPMHTQIPRSAFAKYPELDLGGRVTVLFFGDEPREVFLTAHPLAEKPMQSSAALLIGICLLITGIGLGIVAFYTS